MHVAAMSKIPKRTLTVEERSLLDQKTASGLFDTSRNSERGTRQCVFTMVNSFTLDGDTGFEITEIAKKAILAARSKK
jgi:hypothetical protein